MNFDFFPKSGELGFDPDLLQKIHSYCIEKGITLSVAESCTAGLLSSLIVGQSGASAYYKGGVVSYWNEIKNELLGVSEEILKKHGAVSCECAEAMAQGVRTKFHTDYALSITGIAGPDGGTPTKPVGTVWIGFSSKNETFAKNYLFDGDRNKIRLLSAYSALEILLLGINSAK